MKEIVCKVLIKHGNYVDAGKLAEGIYFTLKPELYEKGETIENLIKRGKQIKDMVGNQIIPESWFDNLKQCELVEVKVKSMKA